MKTYASYIDLLGVRTKIVFVTDILPIEYIWRIYGISTFVESITEVSTEIVTEKDDMEEN